jgi:hypothetical protein
MCSSSKSCSTTFIWTRRQKRSNEVVPMALRYVLPSFQLLTEDRLLCPASSKRCTCSCQLIISLKLRRILRVSFNPIQTYDNKSTKNFNRLPAIRSVHIGRRPSLLADHVWFPFNTDISHDLQIRTVLFTLWCLKQFSCLGYQYVFFSVLTPGSGIVGYLGNNQYSRGLHSVRLLSSVLSSICRHASVRRSFSIIHTSTIDYREL